MFLGGRAYPRCAMSMLLTLIGWLVGLVAADCECGYTAKIDGLSSPYLFTDVLESDFLHIRNISYDTDWKRQEFSVTAAAGRGPYGMNYTVGNIVSNPIANLTQWTGPGRLGANPGLLISVDPGVPSDGYVRVAEMNSAREDMLWGSYRAAMRLTPVAGTCAAFFWYFNDTQEIDMEFLSSEFRPENKTFPVNLVLQSEEARKAGFNAANTGNYFVVNLPFDPTDGFHEYRIDFVPQHIVFYGDGILLGKMNSTAVPTNPSPGHMILTHWSNGNPLWSYGPPTEEAILTVSYVKAYFNSSSQSRQESHDSRCVDSSSPHAVCAIPDQFAALATASTPPGEDSPAQTYFFSDEKNKTVGQTIYKKSGSTTSIDSPIWALASIIWVWAVSLILS